ncbi:membrane protein insertion efficiency factor YidD [Legionella taurinensis]|uniref:Putative membrane protein insertion efficiency factor n=1 Tax=Legionella taurinensis TaxID=70611 RepID=A0A3A5L497_9GAMM|nr:membrane protein insertion efficiency factor YidD [Legionella taurinensis]MDX1836230.1 membrane protein insertion efficiency factor YidD [Legionella taurinensis]PUT42010.1 membrane protein insertion efficiency factor YidD [Legionella taurinensis]PUT44797.1 membrane protein insertion efficiency factor YidD [Legionella taurinensis]PUT48118.1 membrane protein insertion efficiency factor YidD [Legionella taurinensis]PUT48932.1 membrane protein insertion efficiency factor YidD [Legionella taurin
MEQINRILRQLVALPIIMYQLFIRPVMKPSCRFYPSCSQYALTAIRRFGVLKGMKLACCRLMRCHPWCDGGYDPVLPNEEKH